MNRSSCPTARPSDPVAYLVDTNIAIHLRDGLEPVMAKMAEHSGDVALSALRLGDLQRGLYRSPGDEGRRRSRLATILLSMPVLSFDAAAAETYARIIAKSGWVRGRDFDRMIAADAISSGRTLVKMSPAIAPRQYASFTTYACLFEM